MKLYYDLASPYAYLAVARAADVLGTEPELRPVLVGAIFGYRGRGSWALTDERAAGEAEIERRAARYGLPPVVWPEGWPVNSLRRCGRRPGPRRRAPGRRSRTRPTGASSPKGAGWGRTCWARPPRRRASIPTRCPPAIAHDAVKLALRQATEAAWELGVQGVPTLEGRRAPVLRRRPARGGGGLEGALGRAPVHRISADDAGVGTSVPERFSEPLSAAMPDGAARARVRLRLAGALLFGAGSLTLAAVLAAPDPDPSDHAALSVCALTYGLLSALLLLWRRPPAAVLHAICPAGTVAATAAVALREPVGLTPIFYLWPMLVAAYFLGRREVAANLAFVAGASALALALWVDPVLRLAMFFAVLAIVGVVTAVVVVLREQVLALVMRLRTLASHDSLTGALNRGAFEQRLDAELARSRASTRRSRSSSSTSTTSSRINDRFGHAAGDDALRGIGDAVSGGMRRSDIFGRLGGEEFGLVLPDTDMAGAAIVADKLRVRLAARDAAGPSLTVSFGVAEVHGGRAGAREMFDEADRALYAAKRAGRDRVVRSDEIGLRARWRRRAATRVLALLVRPVAVLGEVLAGGVLVVALAVAAGAEPEQPVEQPHREPGADAHREALVARGVRRGEQQHEAREHQRRGKPVADAAEHAHSPSERRPGPTPAPGRRGRPAAATSRPRGAGPPRRRRRGRSRGP